MKKIRLFLAEKLGSLGFFVYLLLLIIIGAMPAAMITTGFGWSLLIVSVMFLIPQTSVIFWIWGLVAAINGVQDFLAIIYYVLFAILFLPIAVGIIIDIVNLFYQPSTPKRKKRSNKELLEESEKDKEFLYDIISTQRKHLHKGALENCHYKAINGVLLSIALYLPPKHIDLHVVFDVNEFFYYLFNSILDYYCDSQAEKKECLKDFCSVAESYGFLNPSEQMLDYTKEMYSSAQKGELASLAFFDMDDYQDLFVEVENACEDAHYYFYLIGAFADILSKNAFLSEEIVDVESYTLAELPNLSDEQKSDLDMFVFSVFDTTMEYIRDVYRNISNENRYRNMDIIY